MAITLMARAISGNYLLRAHRDPIVDGDLICIRVPHSKRPHHPPTTPLPVTQPSHMHHHDRDPEGGHTKPLLEGTPSVCPIRVRVALAKRVEKGAVPAARGDPISMQPTCNQNAISMQSVGNHRAIIEQSACHQRAISVREVGEEPFGREEELGGGCRRVVWHAERRLRNRDSDQQRSAGSLSMHSACNHNAIRMQSADALSVHSACNQRTCETETQSPGLHRCTRGAYCRSGCSCIVLRLAGRTSAVDIRFIHPPSRISCAA